MSDLRRRGTHRAPRQPDALASLSSVAPTTSAAPRLATTAERTPNVFSTLVGYGALVAEMAALLALPPERIARAEALDRLEITTNLTATELFAWDTGAVKRWFASFEDDLELDLRLMGLDSASSSELAVSLRAGRDPQRALRHFIEETQHLRESQGNELDVEIRLSIAKTRAVAGARAILATRPEYPGSPDLLAVTNVFVFYHAASLEKLLRFGALADWEQRGLACEQGRAVIVLCDATGYLAGMALEVLGARQPEAETHPHWLAFSRAAWRELQERAHETRDLHTAESNWPGAPRTLTPAHLRLAQRTPGLEPLAQQLHAMRAALSAAYLASTVTGEVNTELLLRFTGPRPAVCHLAAKATNNPPIADTAHATDGDGGESLARLAAWAYQHASPDKLAIARECLAGELPAGTSVSLATVEHAAQGALEAAKANFALYLRGNTAQYFALRQRALDAVADYAANMRKAVSDLTSDVVDTVYRTAGLLVGVVFATLLQPRLALTVQQIAALLFTGYLLFVVYYLLGARYKRFTLEKSDLQARLAAMPELSESERARIAAEANGANDHFELYFRRSRLIYLALAAVGALYFVLLLTPLAAHLPLAPTPVHR